MPTRILRDWTDSFRVNEVSAEGERFFTRLIMKADDFGRFHAHPSLLKASLFPLRLDAIREADITRWTAECAKAGLIALYEFGQKPYLEIVEYRQRTKPGQKSRFPGNSGKIPESPAQGGGVGVISEAEAGNGADAPPPAEVPTEAEVVAFGSNAGIPPDYCKRFHAKTSESHSWITAHGRLFDWKRRLPRYWHEDQPTWGRRKGTGPARANINDANHSPC